MTVPDFQTLMFPLLEYASDGQPHHINDAIEALANYYQLSEDDRRELLPSGKQFRFDNRVHWARAYLVRAGLFESVARGKFQITANGQKVVTAQPGYINIKYLEQFPEFVKFRTRSTPENATSAATDESDEANEENTRTPHEILESSYQRLREGLAQELLDRIKQCPPRFFEKLVVDLLVAMGYGGTLKDAGKVIGQSGDEGIDGIINEDRLGLDVVYVQAKRWQNGVGRPEVQNFVGSLEGMRARKGVFITTSHFSEQAKGYVKNIGMRIVLIDGQELAQYMIDYGVGVNVVNSYVVKRVDLDYFESDG